MKSRKSKAASLKAKRAWETRRRNAADADIVAINSVREDVARYRARFPQPLAALNKAAEADPNGLSPHAPGAKLDAGKAPIMRGAVQAFPRALEAVSGISNYGAEKYTWGGWESVSDGYQRYTDAMGRHIIAESIHGPRDPDTGLSHVAQVAWNALARLELMLRQGPQP